MNALWRRDLVTSLLGVWLVSAVYADGWAHLNVPGLESFFTVWHAALYSGLLAFGCWLAFWVWRGKTETGRWLGGLPAGYRLAVLGVVLFGAGGMADMVWHLTFGVEAGVDALLSPSHLVLLAGGTLMVTTGWRSAKATFPGLLSIACAAALAGFFLSYVSAFTQATPTTVFHMTPEGTPGHAEAELPVTAALGGYVVSTVLLVVVLLLAGTPRPRWLLTVTVGLLAGLSAAMIDLPAVAVWGAAGATAGAVLADLLASRISVLPLGAGVAVLLIWTGQLAGFAIGDAVRWPVTLWSGVVLLSALIAAMVTLPVVLARRVQPLSAR